MMVVEGDKPLPLQLFTEDDDDDAIAIRSRLEALINGSVLPTQAAIDFDAWLVREAEQRLKAFQKRIGQDRYDLTAEEEERGVRSLRSIGPDPEGHINHLFEGIARLCSSFPPFHAAQSLLIEFLEALRALQQHDVPTVTPIWRLYDGNTGELSVQDHPGWDMIRLWPFTDPDGVLSNLVKSKLRKESESKYPPSRTMVCSLRAAHLASMENVFGPGPTANRTVGFHRHLLLRVFGRRDTRERAPHPVAQLSVVRGAPDRRRARRLPIYMCAARHPSLQPAVSRPEEPQGWRSEPDQRGRDRRRTVGHVAGRGSLGVRTMQEGWR